MSRADEISEATALIVTTYVRHRSQFVMPDGITDLFRRVTLCLMDMTGQPPDLAHQPPEAMPDAVPEGVTVAVHAASGLLQCRECGWSFYSLRGHLRQKHAMTPEDYCLRHGLPATAPMVARRPRRGRGSAVLRET